MAVEPEELSMTWFTHEHPHQPAAGKQPAPQTTQGLEERFKERTDAIDTKLTQFEQSVQLMIRLMDERLTGFEARLPPSPVQPARPATTKAKRHDTPLFSHPPVTAPSSKPV